MTAALQFSNLAKTFTVEKRRVPALHGVSGALETGKVTGLVGPDGAGKTTLIRLLAGLLQPDSGTIEVAGGAGARVAYMPQRFGLYEDLTVSENLSLYADLNGLNTDARTKRFEELHRFTGLAPFGDRLAGKLSGGMKQKLGLACTLVVAPDVLLLDEPSVGVDPLSRRELWSMVRALQDTGISVLWSTAYLDEAERCDHVMLLHEGRMLEHGTPDHFAARVRGRVWNIGLPEQTEFRKRDFTRAASGIQGVVDAQIKGRNLHLVMENAVAPPDYAANPLLGRQPAEQKIDAAPGQLTSGARSVVIETRKLTKRFGAFTAVDEVSFAVSEGEIFGLMGPNGAGKSTTFKMLCGLLPASGGDALVAGYDLRHTRAAARSRIGYMAQKFAYLGHLTVGQNMHFAAGVYGLSGKLLEMRVREAMETYGLGPYIDSSCMDLPLGIKQRMALACAVMHKPRILFLDEPTSGVDPVTRREFWNRINAMADEGVTILVTSHFLDEAEYCDRLVIIYRSKLIAQGSPAEVKAMNQAASGEESTLEEAFIALVEQYDLDEKAGKAA